MAKNKRRRVPSKKDDRHSPLDKQYSSQSDSRERRHQEANKRPGKAVRTSFELLVALVVVIVLILAAVLYSTRDQENQEKTQVEKVPGDVKLSSTDHGDGGWGRASFEDEKLFNISFCNIERRFAEDLPNEEFERNYRFKKPLLVRFRNGAAGWTQPEKWTKESLIQEYGRWEVFSGKCDDIVKRGGSGDTKTSFRDYLKLMHDSRHKLEPMYVFDRSFYHDSDLPSTIRPPTFFQFKDKLEDSIFFLGTSRSGVSFHKHADTWNGVVFGRKRWFLYSPDRTPPGGVWPSYSQQDWIKNVYPHLKNEELPTNECVQEAGEILYLPESYYHATVNIGDTIAVAIQKKQASSRIEKIMYEAGKLEREIRQKELAEDSPEVRKQLNLFKELSALLPNSTEALHKLANAYSKMNEDEKAAEILERAITMDPWFVNARVDLARFYLYLDREDEARKQFEEALKIHPEHVEGNHYYGSFLMEKKEYQKAAEKFRQAIRIKPNVSTGYVQLAEALEQMGDAKGAEKARKNGAWLEEQERLNEQER